MDIMIHFNCLIQAFLVMAAIGTVFGENANISRGPSYEHPIRTSSLMCYQCINEAYSDNCITMANTSKVMVLRCKEKEAFCKVRRFETNGKLTTFDRECAQDCTPGCNEGIIYEECISCCTTSLCNTDNGAPTATIATTTHVCQMTAWIIGVTMLVYVL